MGSDAVAQLLAVQPAGKMAEDLAIVRSKQECIIIRLDGDSRENLVVQTSLNILELPRHKQMF